ncbi:unnamed protein product, partial [Meganyctiphanes norvegica]
MKKYRKGETICILMSYCLLHSYNQTDITFMEDFKVDKHVLGTKRHLIAINKKKIKKVFYKFILYLFLTFLVFEIKLQKIADFRKKKKFLHGIRCVCTDLTSSFLTSREELASNIAQNFLSYGQKLTYYSAPKSQKASLWRYRACKINRKKIDSVTQYTRKHHQVQLSKMTSAEGKYLRNFGRSKGIIVQRHPLTRLVSAWKNKYHEGNSLKKYDAKKEAKVAKIIFTPSWLYNVQTFWVPAMATNGLIPSNMHKQLGLATPLNPNQEYPRWVYISLQRMLKPSIDFTQFLKHVVKTFNSSSEDPHWNVFSHECSPCSLHYDYIAKVETFSEDLEYIFKHIGIPSDPNIQKNKIKKKNDNPYAYISYYTKIPLDLRKSLYMIYRKDMDMFGYNLPDWFLSEKAH